MLILTYVRIYYSDAGDQNAPRASLISQANASNRTAKQLQITLDLVLSREAYRDRRSPTASVATMHFTADTVIVITGSSRGLGLEFVKHFLEYTDSKVVATARSLSKADDLRTLMTQYSKRLQTVALDTSEESSIEVTHAGQTQPGVYANVGLDDCKVTVDLHAVS